MSANGEIRLRVESVNGSPVNDYRIRNGSIEVRSLDRSGRPLPRDMSHWRALDDNDIQLHYALRTIVAKWLDARLGADTVVLDKAA